MQTGLRCKTALGVDQRPPMEWLEVGVRKPFGTVSDKSDHV